MEGNVSVGKEGWAVGVGDQVTKKRPGCANVRRQEIWLCRICMCRIVQQDNLNTQNGRSKLVVAVKGRGKGEQTDKSDGSHHKKQSSHYSFGLLLLTVGGLLSTGATLSRLYLLVELGLPLHLFPAHMC